MLAETNLTAETTMEEFADALRRQTADGSLEQAQTLYQGIRFPHSFRNACAFLQIP